MDSLSSIFSAAAVGTVLVTTGIHFGIGVGAEAFGVSDNLHDFYKKGWDFISSPFI